ILSYLEDKFKELDVLNLYPRIKQIFFKYNTLLPLSIPIERFFSCGHQILILHRNCLSDKMFKKLLFLKNKD
ncbi:hypothetical protein ALC56_01726, partial [Trachymyrmex septentrionalis]